MHAREVAVDLGRAAAPLDQQPTPLFSCFSKPRMARWQARTVTNQNTSVSRCEKHAHLSPGVQKAEVKTARPRCKQPEQGNDDRQGHAFNHMLHVTMVHACGFSLLRIPMHRYTYSPHLTFPCTRHVYQHGMRPSSVCGACLYAACLSGWAFLPSGRQFVHTFHHIVIVG